MHEDAIDQVMQEISLYGRLGATYSAQDATEALCNIRALLEQLVAQPSVTPWHMIEDGETYMIINADAGQVFCRGMDAAHAWSLVRQLNEIEA